MFDHVKKLERVLTIVLMAMMAVVVVLSIADLAWELVRDILTPPVVLLDVSELLNVFGAFLLVLIGIELLETVRAYVSQREIRAEVILLVAIIALARKIITLDLKELAAPALLGIAAIVVALGITYALIKQGRGTNHA
jgi:uncharacterized membrane protein (DUF373 family)